MNATLPGFACANLLSEMADFPAPEQVHARLKPYSGQ
jgi:hypothetical protein